MKKGLPTVKVLAGYSGDRGIRTLDTLWGYTHFPGVPLQPLEQVSIGCEGRQK